MRGSGVTRDGAQTPDRLEVAADAAGVAAAAEWAEAWGRAESYDPETVFAMRLCVEEAVTNIVFYAYPEDQTRRWVRVDAARTAAGARLEVRDAGRPFDSSHAEDLGVEHDIDSATVGGRGIRLMRAFSHGLTYRRVGGENRLAFAFIRDRRAPDR